MTRRGLAVALACLLAAVALAGCGGDDDGPLYQVLYPGGFHRAVEGIEGIEERIGLEVVEPPGTVLGLPLTRVIGHTNDQRTTFQYEDGGLRVVIGQGPPEQVRRTGTLIEVSGAEVERSRGPFGQVSFAWEACERRFVLSSVPLSLEADAEAVVGEVIARCSADRAAARPRPPGEPQP